MIVYKVRQLEKSSNRKLRLILSTLVATWIPNIAFHLLPIWLQTLVVIDSESRLTLFPSFCAPPSQVAALFNSNLSRRPFLRQVVDSDLLLCTGFDSEHAVLFLCHIFTQRPINDRKIERSWAAQLRSILRSCPAWALLWSATTSRQFHRKFISHENKK